MQNEEQQTVSDEISLKGIVDFLRRNQWLMVFWILAGLLFSIAYLAQVPKKYEAKWQMQMAQYVNSTGNGNSNSNNSNVNSEEPAELIQRLRAPTIYPIGVQQSCGMPENGEFGDYLGGTLKVDLVKNVTNAVEMKVSTTSQDQAKKCAEAIVAMIVAEQRGLIEERLVGRQAQLLKYQQALREEQQQLETIKKSELGNFGYLAQLDKLSWLRTRIDALQEEALLSQMHPAKLVAPIYVPSKPVPFKAGLLLLLGVSLGLMLGVLNALVRDGWRKAA